MTTVNLSLTQDECDYIGTLLVQGYLQYPHLNYKELAEKIRLQVAAQWRTKP